MAATPDQKPGPEAHPTGETTDAAAWQGRRVVVRSLVRGERGPSGGPALTDAVGIVESADETEIVVRRRDGSMRRVAVDDIVVIKAVPPAPPRRGPRGSSSC